MTDEDLDKLADFTARVMQYLEAVEIKQNFAGKSEIVFETSHKGEKTVQKFLVAAPINMTVLITELRGLYAFIAKVLAKSMEEDGEPDHPISETTKMLQEFVDNRQSIGTTESPEELMKKAVDGEAKA